MKVSVALAAFILAVGFSLVAIAQSQLPGGISQPEYANQTTGVGTTSKSGGGAAPAGTPDQEANTAEHDDTLYRGRTDEMENNFLRDDGMLHFKTLPKEKTQKVDSLKSLQTSGTDPKFKGELAISGVSSIDKVAPKPVQEHELQTENGDEQTEPPSDSRFVRRHLTFSPPPEDQSKKNEAESTPSPTPSPTASPAAKNSEKSKE